MPKLSGIAPEIIERIPYIPLGPEEWFKEMGMEDKGGPPPMGAGPVMKPTVYVKNGKLCSDGANIETLYGGEFEDKCAKDLRIVSYDGMVGGIFCEGADTDYTVEGAVISLSGDGSGLGEKSAGAGVSGNATLTLKDVLIDVTGLSRTCTSASGNSVLKVYDSVLASHGAPYGKDCPGEAPKMSPPAALEIEGNNRTHCTVQQSYSYFYNSLITCDGWAALSTDASGGFVYLEANDCKVVATKSGYGCYADWGCHDVFNNTVFDVACMAAIMAGEASVTFNSCEAKCGSYLGLIHCVMGRHTEVGEFTVSDSKVKTKKEVVLVKSQNVIIDFDNCELESGNGILVRTMKNPDPNATQVKGRPVFGDEVWFTDMTANGDILHEDYEREMRVYLTSAVLKGAVKNAVMLLDLGSKWYATADSDVVIGCEVDVAQIDAPAGITITAKAADGQGEYDLASGGKLIVK